QAEDGIRYRNVTGVQTCALPIFKRTFIPARFDNGFHNFRTDVANSTHAEANIVTDCLKVLGGLVDIWRQDLNAKVSTVSQVDGRSEERRVGKEGGSRAAGAHGRE